MHREEKRAKTRARLVEAALNVFAFGGYEHASVDDIAHAAGLSKGAFYFNFSSKEEILIQLLRQWAEERTSLLNAAFAFEEDAGRRLRAMAEALASYRGGTNWPPLVLEFWSQAMRAGEIGRRLRRAYRDWRELLATAAGEAGSTEPGAKADAILALHDGAVTEIALGRAGCLDSQRARVGSARRRSDGCLGRTGGAGCRGLIRAAIDGVRASPNGGRRTIRYHASRC